MNIYVTDHDPFEAASHLDDATLVEQILDVAQLISTYALADGREDIEWYPSIGTDHPCVRWMRNSGDHFMWVLAFGYGLIAEYEERFDRQHFADFILSTAVQIYGYEKPRPLGFINWAKSDFPNLDFSQIQDVPTAYRLYLDAKWRLARRPPRWRNKKPPTWWTEDNSI